MNAGIYPAVSRVKTKTAGPGGILRRCRDRPLNTETPECLGIFRGHAAENLGPQSLAPESPADRKVREKRPPEPYKGKGIRYVGEYVAHKEGKAGKGAK